MIKNMKPCWKPFSAGMGAVILVLVCVTQTQASTAAPDISTMTAAETDRTHQLCERATSRWERISEVPEKLLQAISMTESGRWSATHKRVRAWPWTVTSGGPGAYFPSKAAAMREVRRLQAKGVQNIDVGCMQVNMQYHGHEFRSVEDAMDPDINAAYAAKFLIRLRENAGSWGEAAGHYHSFTPERTTYYRGKVEKFWASLNGQPNLGLARRMAPKPEDTPSTYTIAPIDRARTAALNARFKTLKTAARELRNELDPDVKRARQMEAWRNARGRSEQLQHLLAVRQAEMQARRQRELAEFTKEDREESFAEARRRQLADWRAHRATN